MSEGVSLPFADGGHGLRMAAGEAVARIGRIEVHEDLAAALHAWRELEAVAPASAYQTHRWVRAWIETIGRACDVRPMIVLVRGRNDAPLALFPFGTVRRGFVRVAVFLGGADSNANLGLIRPGARFDRAEIGALLRVAARMARPRPDAFVLLNQPVTWEGVENPLALVRRQPSPSACHSATLRAAGADFAAERLSADAHKKLRKKERKLAELGPVTHITARADGDVTRIIDAFFAQKLARFEQKRIASHLESPEARQFLLRACRDGLTSGEPAVELHALAAGERIVAVYAGATHRGCFHAMVNSFDPAPEVARMSPGDLLLMSMMRTMAAEGRHSFDLGVGEARYKSAWCDRAEPLVDTLFGVTLKGRLFVLGESARLRLRRRVKQNKRLWEAAQKLRQGFVRRPAGT